MRSSLALVVALAGYTSPGVALSPPATLSTSFLHSSAGVVENLSFHEIWPFNRDANPDRVLRNANFEFLPITMQLSNAYLCSTFLVYGTKKKRESIINLLKYIVAN
jgi:hypothetical protein